MLCSHLLLLSVTRTVTKQMQAAFPSGDCHRGCFSTWKSLRLSNFCIDIYELQLLTWRNCLSSITHKNQMACRGRVATGKLHLVSLFPCTQSFKAGKLQKVLQGWLLPECLGELCLLLVWAAVTTETVPESVPSWLKPGLAW